MTISRRPLFAICTVLSLAACEGHELAGPPALRLGRDQCAGCGMIISDGKCAGALLIESGGRREHVVFDDLGCMLSFEAEHAAESRVIDRFARDHSSEAWLPASTASFLDAGQGRVPTPMGSGIIAFGDRAAAQLAQKTSGGEVLNYAGLAARRAQQSQGARDQNPH